MSQMLNKLEENENLQPGYIMIQHSFRKLS